MRAILLVLLFPVLNGFGQSATGHTTPCDSIAAVMAKTTVLFEPRPSSEDYTTPGDFLHCIDLRGTQPVVTLDKKQYRMADAELPGFFKKNRKKIDSRLFTIVTNHQTPYKQTVDVLDLVTIHRIRRYKLASTDTTASTTAQDSTLLALWAECQGVKDPAYLDITITREALSVSLLHQSYRFAEVAELDSFITNNKSRIEVSKVRLIGHKNLPAQKFLPVSRVLTRHGLHQYHMIATEGDPSQ